MTIAEAYNLVLLAPAEVPDVGGLVLASDGYRILCPCRTPDERANGTTWLVFGDFYFTQDLKASQSRETKGWSLYRFDADAWERYTWGHEIVDAVTRKLNDALRSAPDKVQLALLRDWAAMMPEIAEAAP